jgi:hypothetical protein
MMEKHRLAEIEEYIFEYFRREGLSRLLTRRVFESTHIYANADLVRAFEDLEKQHRLLVRFTDEGHDWLQLTPAGAEYAGLSELTAADAPPVPPHPPKSST